MATFNNMLLSPERGNGNEDQAERFKLDDVLSNYVEFEFQGGDTEEVSSMCDLDFEVSQLSHFTQEVLGKAGFYAENFVSGAEGHVSVREGSEDEFKVEAVDDETGKVLGTIDIDVWINESLEETDLPNGDKLKNMKSYGWKQFKRLESMAKDYEASEENAFADAVETVPDQRDDLQQ